MKFSYDLIEKLIPTAKDRADLVETLTMKSFEAEKASKDTFNAEIPHNRYADAASHMGVAKEYAAITGKKVKEPTGKKVFPGKTGGVEVFVKDKELCPRYGGAAFTLTKKGITPAWMKKVLKDCGLRPINPVVDILNYVMLEIGQPLHAFDADRLHGKIIVRKAKKGEKITTIDNQKFTLDADMLIIADEKEPQAIAGIKGGKYAEINPRTKKIIVEAANFDSVSVYKTSRKLDLVTDASVRFAHGMSPYSVKLGLERTRALLEEIIGAKFEGALDVYPREKSREIIGFSVDRFNSIAGLKLGRGDIEKSLKKLGFKITTPKNKKEDFLVEVPPLRIDITLFEDLVEEVVRLYGLDRLHPEPPIVTIEQAKEEEVVVMKDKVKTAMYAAGYTEVYNYSFVSMGNKTSYELENPLSENTKYLRQDLAVNLMENLASNKRFFEEVRIFEIGNVFDKEDGERLFLGIGLRSKSEDPFLEVKGVVEKLMEKMGLEDFIFRPKGVDLEVESEGETIGIVRISGRETAVAEIDIGALMRIVSGEYEYREIPKYPAVMRDISLEMRKTAKVGEILTAIQDSGAKYVEDVDLVDYYDPKRFTFRVIFQSKDRTLKDKEVSKELDRILAYLKKKFELKIR